MFGSFLLIYRFLPTHTFQPRLVVVCLHLRHFLWCVCFHSVRIVSTHSFLPSCLHPLPPPLTHSLPFIVVILCRNRTGKASATTKTVRAAGKKHVPAQRQPTRFDKDSTYGKLVPSLQWLKEFGLATQVRVCYEYLVSTDTAGWWGLVPPSSSIPLPRWERRCVGRVPPRALSRLKAALFHSIYADNTNSRMHHHHRLSLSKGFDAIRSDEGLCSPA